MSEQGDVAEQTIRELLAKTSHPLLEVRTRSLRSLSLKLRGGLVSAESLVCEQAFLSSLLQWFNFPEWGSEQLPLGLLDTLAEYEVAAVGLVDVGAVDFLSQLRPHCDPSLHPTIDSILEKLLRIPPSLLPPSPHTPPRETDLPTSGPLIQLSCVEDNRQELKRGANPLVIADSKHTPYDIHPNSPPTSLATADQKQCSSPSLPLPPSLLNLVPGSTTSVNPLTISGPSGSSHTVHQTQIHRSLSTEEGAASTGEGKEGERREGKRVFPWLRLSLNDINILRTTENRLLSGESVRESCQFIEDVLLQDFPPEVFLQRSALLRVLFSLLDTQRGSVSTDSSGVCRCLTGLNSQLVSRTNLLEMASPDLFTVKEIHVSSCTQKGLTVATAELTNQIQQRESHDLERLTQEMLVHLKSSEMTLTGYVSRVVGLSTDLLASLLSKAGVAREGEIRSEATSGITATLHLLVSAVELLEAYEKCGARETEGEKGEKQAVESLCLATSHSLALWRHISNKSTPDHAHDSAHHQLACRVCVSLACCLQRTLESTPAGLASLPSSLEILKDLVMDGVVMVAAPQLHGRLSVCLESIDPTSHQILEAVEEIFKAFKNMSCCLKKSSPCDSEPEATPTSLSPRKEVELATAALPCLHVFCNSEFVGREIRLSVSLLKDEKKQADWSTARCLLLRLLAHDSAAVQTTAYSTFTSVLSSDTLASFPRSLGEELLDQLCRHALFSPLDDVVSSAATILKVYLSTARVRGDLWMTDTLVHRLPYIEVSLENDEGFFKEVCDFINSEVVPEPARLHSLLRLMFASIKRRREYGYGELMKLCHLSCSTTAPSLHPTCDLFVNGSLSRHPIAEKTALERKDLVELLKIVRSPVMDDLLKRSALQQLATLLTDASLHEAALEEDTLSTVVYMFKLKLNLVDQTRVGNEVGGGEEKRGEGEGRGGEEEEEHGGFWKACVQCLQLLALTSSDVRSQLSKDDRFLLGLFRASVKSSSDPEFLQSSSSLLAPLVFTHISRWTCDYTMQVPENLLNRLKLTCSVGSYAQENPHQTPQILTPSQLPSPHTLSLLYHLAMSENNVDKLLQSNSAISPATSEEERGEGEERRAASPSLRPGDLESLRYLWPPSALRECLSRFRAARSHSEVSFRLDHLTLVAQYCHLQHQYRVASNSGAGISQLVGHETGERCSKDWEQVFGRFLRVKPATEQDMDLLSHLLSYLTTLLENSDHSHTHQQQGSSDCYPAISGGNDDRGGGQVTRQLQQLFGGAVFLRWLGEETAGEESACLQTLRSLLETHGDHTTRDTTRDHNTRDRKLERALIQFYTSLFPLLPPSSSNHRSPTEVAFPLVALHTLSLGLTQLSVTHHDSLSSIHGCLMAINHLSARLCRGVRNPKVLEICPVDLANSLKETMCSVISGRGEMQASFMGHGLLKKASLSLSLLARGTAATTNQLPQNWLLDCFSSTNSGFPWINLLTHNRDPLVRAAGYSLLASVCGGREVGEILVSQWTPHEKLGPWGALMGVAVDRSEAELVRQQAVKVLVALTGTCHRDSLLLSFTDEQQTLTGAAALELFLKCHSPVQLLVGSAPDCPTLAASLLQLTYNLTLSFPVLLCPRLEALGDDIILRCCDPVMSSVADPLSSAATPSPSLLHLCRSALDLLHAAIAVGSKVIRDLLLSGNNTLRLTQLLVLWRRGVRGEKDVLGVCGSLLRLLVCLWEKAPLELVDVVPASLVSHWDSFTAILQWSLLHPSPSPSLHTLTLPLLHSILAHKLHPPSRDLNHASFDEKLTSLLDPTHQPPSETSRDVESASATCPSSSGAELCAALLDVYEGSEVKLTRQKGCGLGVGLVSLTLCLLLASSQSAKQTALKGGLLETSLEGVRCLHSQILCTDSTTNRQKPASTSHRKKDPRQVPQMCERLAVVKCLLYRSPQLKTVALESGLVSLLSAVWPQCTVSVPLATAVLDTLTVFTAGNSRGRAALATGSRGGESLLYRIAGHASHCISSHRSCVASRSPASPLSPVLVSSMSLVANCSLSSEGRRVLKKAAFLENFASLSLPQPKPSSSSSSSSSSPQTHGVCEAALWIKVLINFTLSSDGQHTVIKLPGVVEELLDLHQRPDLVQPHLCLLTLRNLCFYGPGKTLLVDNGTVFNKRFLWLLAGGLEPRQEMWTRAVTASAVWALCHNCAKIRKTLRGTGGLSEKLTHLHSALSLQQTTPPSPPPSLLHLYTTNLSNAARSLSIQ